VVTELDWLNILMDRSGIIHVIQAEQVLFCSRIPGHLFMFAPPSIETTIITVVDENEYSLLLA